MTNFIAFNCERMLLRIALIITMLICCLPANAQDSPLTLWCYNLHALNPSLAGSADQLRLNMFYRNQWHKADAGFQFYGASADMPVAKSLGCGIGFANDHAAAFAKPSVYGSCSYHVKTGRQSEMRYGIRLGLAQKYLSASDLTFEQTEFVPNKSSGVRLDAGIGASVTAGDFFAGAVLDHLLRPRQSIDGTIESRTAIKLTLDAGYICKIATLGQKNIIEITPMVIFQQQGKQQNLQFNVIGQANWLLMGIACRKNLNADMPFASIILGYSALDFRLAYSYDIDTNKKTTRMGNAHEISITKLFETKRKEKHKSIDCPSFLR
jgi:type IX secretion system PorP/SprF family membrane protein